MTINTCDIKLVACLVPLEMVSMQLSTFYQHL
jgi:hypothetical protein